MNASLFVLFWNNDFNPSFLLNLDFVKLVISCWVTFTSCLFHSCRHLVYSYNSILISFVHLFTYLCLGYFFFFHHIFAIYYLVSICADGVMDRDSWCDEPSSNSSAVHYIDLRAIHLVKVRIHISTLLGVHFQGRMDFQDVVGTQFRRSRTLNSKPYGPWTKLRAVLCKS